jgi:hypothetical protein
LPTTYNFMKKIFALVTCSFLATAMLAQDTTSIPKKKSIDLSNRSNDHVMVQFGYTNWASAPDSAKPSGFSKSFNVYFMFDFPFKTNPKMSIALGPGISTDHILFKKTYVGIKDLTTTIRFDDRSDTNHFQKTKLATAYFEAPIEFRYTADPSNPNKSFKFAVGVKVGTMISAHTRNAKYQDSDGVNDYVMKESSKRFFNKNRLVGMARAGFGHFTLYGSYQLTTLFKDGAGPQVRPFSIGLTLSGL